MAEEGPNVARVTIRYWAAAREAAGVAQEQVEATTLAQALELAVAAHGERLAYVLARCSFVVDEAPAGTRPRHEVRLGEASVVEVLPPFAGGAHASAAEGLALPGERPPLREAATAVVVTIALGAALAVASDGGDVPMTAVLAVAQACLLGAWFAAVGGHARLPSFAVSLAVVVGGDLALLRLDGDNAASTQASSLGPLATAAACAVLALLVVQLARRGGRRNMTGSLAAGVCAVVMAVLAAAFVALRAAPAGRELTVVAFVAVAAAAPAALAPGAAWVQPLPAAALGAAAGAVAGLLLESGVSGGMSAPTAAAVGAAVGLLSAVGRVAAGQLAPGNVRMARTVLATTLPLALVAPVALVVGRILAG